MSPVIDNFINKNKRMFITKEQKDSLYPLREYSSLDRAINEEFTFFCEALNDKHYCIRCTSHNKTLIDKLERLNTGRSEIDDDDDGNEPWCYFYIADSKIETWIDMPGADIE